VFKNEAYPNKSVSNEQTATSYIRQELHYVYELYNNIVYMWSKNAYMYIRM